jgi:hypothetical protein
MSKYWKTNSKIDDNLLKEIINTIPSNTFFKLNHQKNVFTLLEKLVYTITSFHLNRLNINSKYVDFGFVEKNTDLFIPFHDSNVQSISNLSLLSIVVFFDNNNNNPFLMANLTEEKYKYKDFNEINISCSFPKKLNHVIFEPNKYYYSLHSEKILLINVFDKNNSYSIPDKLFASNHYLDSLNNLSFEFEENEFKTILFKESKNGFNYDYFDEFIYLDSLKYKELTNLIQSENLEIYDTFEFKLDNTKTSIIENKELINTSIPKFIQRFIKKKVYQSNICDWIIKESERYAIENGGWTTTRHIKYPTTDLPLNKITSIFPFVVESFNNIVQFIKTSYCLDDNHIFNVSDIFIVKYDANRQSNLELHTDYSEISVNILLSDPKDFEGGGTYFEDEITTFLEKGDVLIHGGQTKHSGLEITKGKRYILVAFIHIYN